MMRRSFSPPWNEGQAREGGNIIDMDIRQHPIIRHHKLYENYLEGFVPRKARFTPQVVGTPIRRQKEKAPPQPVSYLRMRLLPGGTAIVASPRERACWFHLNKRPEHGIIVNCKFESYVAIQTWYERTKYTGLPASLLCPCATWKSTLISVDENFGTNKYALKLGDLSRRVKFPYNDHPTQLNCMWETPIFSTAQTTTIMERE